MEFSQELIELLKYLFLGFVQGFTEPIPVSSSGHLMFIQHFIGLGVNGLSFAVLVNFASLLAVLVIYRHDLVAVIRGFIRYVTTKDDSAKSDFKFGIYLIIATIPAGVIGLLFDDWIEDKISTIQVVAVALLVTGVFLFLIRNLKGVKGDHEITLKEVIVVGLAQAVALIPGISRSGATIVAAMGLGWKQETALRFSFFLFIPVSLGSGILAITDIINDPQFSKLFIPYLVAFLMSFIATYFSLKWFMNIMRSGKLIYFSIYCFVVGTLVLVLV